MVRATGHLADLPTRDLIGVEILAPGEWNKFKYTMKHQQNMVSAFETLKGRVRPFGKLGHDNGQALAQADGYPAIGWIDRLYLSGNKLLADFTKVPSKVASLIAAGAYDAVSAEIYFDFKLDGETYPTVLKAVSFLGGDMPAVKDIQSISDVASLYSELEDADKPKIVYLEYREEEPKMDRKELAKLLKLSEDATDEQIMAKIAENNAAATAAAEAAKNPKPPTMLSENEHAELTGLRDQVGVLIRSMAEEQAERLVDTAVRTGKIVPAQKPWLKSYALSDLETARSFVTNAPRVAQLSTLGHEHGQDPDAEDEVAIERREAVDAAVDAQLGSLAPSKETLMKYEKKPIGLLAREQTAARNNR